jgi:hypothetical protein
MSDISEISESTQFLQSMRTNNYSKQVLENLHDPKYLENQKIPDKQYNYEIKEENILQANVS